MTESQRDYALVFHEDKPAPSRTREYGIWATMCSRCENPKVDHFPRYGGRGISVCLRWRRGEDGKTGFSCFMQDMGPRPSRKHSIHRKDGNGNYEPGNCVWATSKRQANERSSNHLITYNGETLSMMMMAERHGLSYFVLRDRIMRKWPIKDAIETPAVFGAKHRKWLIARGEKLPQSRLTEIKVRQIRASYAAKEADMYELADTYEVSPAAICLAINRKTWAHVK